MQKRCETIILPISNFLKDLTNETIDEWEIPIFIDFGLKRCSYREKQIEK